MRDVLGVLPTLVDPEQMADELKYREEEVGEIFDLAASRHEVGRPSSSDEGGLTLAELQEVGLEVGIEPSRIAEAALAVDKRRGVLPRRTSLGMPISVGRVIELPGAVADPELPDHHCHRLAPRQTYLGLPTRRDDLLRRVSSPAHF